MHTKRRLSFIDVLIVAIPLTQVFKFDFVGVLYGPDIAYLVALPFLLAFNSGNFLRREVRTFLFLASAWLLGAIITDVFRGTPWDDIARGWSKILLFELEFLAIWLLVNNDLRRMILLIVAHALGGALEAVLNPSSLAEYDPWKFGIGVGVTVLALYVVSIQLPQRFIIRIISASVIFSIALISLYLNYRSLFGITAATGLFAAAKILMDTRRRPITKLQFVGMIAIGLGVAQGLFVFYGFAADKGWLGLDAQDKYVVQTSGDLSSILAGRGEVLVSMQAVSDSPIIGHGSWARDVYYVAQLVDLLESKGIKIQGDPFQSDLIPSHSHIMGAWVEAGFLGGLFWIWALIVCLRALYAAVNLRNPAMVVVAFSTIFLIWDILFSPFAAFERFDTGARICLALLIISEQRRIQEDVPYLPERMAFA
jgi:hypothetical protein